jgi:hypothetical protein
VVHEQYPHTQEIPGSAAVVKCSSLGEHAKPAERQGNIRHTWDGTLVGVNQWKGAVSPDQSGWAGTAASELCAKSTPLLTHSSQQVAAGWLVHTLPMVSGQMSARLAAAEMRIGL